MVRRIKKHVAVDRAPGDANIGAFAGMFDLSALGLREPVLVSGTDGVAPSSSCVRDGQHTRRHRRSGHVRQRRAGAGAEPLGVPRLSWPWPQRTPEDRGIRRRVAEGCPPAGCALVGGETAEMPAMYATRVRHRRGFTVVGREVEAHRRRRSDGRLLWASPRAASTPTLSAWCARSRGRNCLTCTAATRAVETAAGRGLLTPPDLRQAVWR